MIGQFARLLFGSSASSRVPEDGTYLRRLLRPPDILFSSRLESVVIVMAILVNAVI